MPVDTKKLRELAEEASPFKSPNMGGDIDPQNPVWGPRLKAFKDAVWPGHVIALLDRIAELERLFTPKAELFEEGYWTSCSGCHESNEGHPTGPYNAALRCNVGSGCRECGGIGARWEEVDEDALKAAAATDEEPPARVTENTSCCIACGSTIQRGEEVRDYEEGAAHAHGCPRSHH